jgi:hypothetical protein
MPDLLPTLLLTAAGATTVMTAVGWWAGHEPKTADQPDESAKFGAEDDDSTSAWLGEMHDEPLLCDQPARPPHGSDAWWATRLAMRHPTHTALVWRRLDDAIGGAWAALLAEAEADLAEWHRLTDAVFTATAEQRILELAGGAAR